MVHTADRAAPLAAGNRVGGGAGGDARTDRMVASASRFDRRTPAARACGRLRLVCRCGARRTRRTNPHGEHHTSTIRAQERACACPRLGERHRRQPTAARACACLCAASTASPRRRAAALRARRRAPSGIAVAWPFRRLPRRTGAAIRTDGAGRLRFCAPRVLRTPRRHRLRIWTLPTARLCTAAFMAGRAAPAHQRYAGRSFRGDPGSGARPWRRHRRRDDHWRRRPHAAGRGVYLC